MSRVRIKVCGLTDPEEARLCALAGADWIGLNFFDRSPRRVPESLAAEIVAALPSGTEPVGLFVNSPPAEVARVAARLNLSIVQLHGEEPVDDLVHLSHLRVVRAFRLADAVGVEAMVAYLRAASRRGVGPFAVLVDAYVPGQAGGTGQAIAPEVLSHIPELEHLILAGGLTPANVADRLERFRPWMVDVASGVETSPGRKDVGLVHEFVKAVGASAGRRGDGVPSSG